MSPPSEIESARKLPDNKDPAAPAERAPRLVSLDAYRGLIMVLLVSRGLDFAEVAKHAPGACWSFLGRQTDHVPWVGCVLWDLIQPAFMFMVGVAIPYSYARRELLAASRGGVTGHALRRALVLIVLGIFLASAWDPRTDFTFVEVLTQIGLGYVFVVLLRNRGLTVQSAALLAILVGYWALFLAYPSPQPGSGFDLAAHGLPKDWPLLDGMAAHWNKNANFAAWFDQWFLKLFPREKPFKFNEGGYQTLNFVPSIATMILGLMTGELLRGPRSPKEKLTALLLAGLVLMVGGLAMGSTICPIVKRIWTPSWVLFSGAWVVWMLAALYAVIELAGYRRWAKPLTIVGMNPIAIYVVSYLSAGWIWNTLTIHFGYIVRSEVAQAALRHVFGTAGFNPVYLPIVRAVSVLLVLWLFSYWMYRQKIFVRI